MRVSEMKTVEQLARKAGLHIYPEYSAAFQRFHDAAIAQYRESLLAGVGEPVAYLAWRDGKPCYEGDDAVCEDAVWPVDWDDDRESMPVYTADQLAAAVREKCAKVAESQRDYWVDGSDQWGNPCPAKIKVTPATIAAAIRGQR